MVVLQIIGLSKIPILFVKVKPRYWEMARGVHGLHLQIPKNRHIDKLYEMFGGEHREEFPTELGEIIKTPVGCTEFYWFTWI